MPSLTAAAQADTTAALHRGANWLFLIAGLSVINVISLATGSQWVFLGGLGVTQVAAQVAMQMGGRVQFVALFINLWAVAFFACLGYFARKGQKWAFLTGMILYAMDALLVLLGQAWIMLLFHGYIFYRLYHGYASCNAMHAFDKRYSGSGTPIGS
jgi:hypothetical protein